MQKQITPARLLRLIPSDYRENLPPKRPRRRLLSLFKEWIMHNTTQPIDRVSLLIEANKLIRDHEDTLAGIEATGVEQRNGVLVFSGEYFLDEQGLPTPKSTAVFNMFKYLAHTLSEKYHLVD
ncbi:YciN [Enterobacter ludwigii]|uniref:YciN n=2 Tax=Enterobacteriaceae TaxID=543 RepID=G8LDT3_9ENTR|nr:YciN [Enterobacter ludwigii]